MTYFAGATLPRKPGVAPDYRKYTCPECGEWYHSPSGIEPHACPTCRLKPEIIAREKVRVRERRKVREARARARGRG